MAQRRKVARLGLRGAALLVSLGLASLPFIVLAQTVFDTPIQSAAQLTGVPNVAPGTPVQSSASTSFSDQGCARDQTIVGVDVTQVDLEAGTATAGIWACLAANLARSIHGPSAGGPPTLTVAGHDADLTVSLARLVATESRLVRLQLSSAPPGQMPMIPVGSVTPAGSATPGLR